MTISTKGGAASGTAVSPDFRPISSLKAASSPPHALTVSSSHYAYEPEKDHWSGSLHRPMRSLDDAFAAHGFEEDHRSKLLRLMRSLSEPDTDTMVKVGIVSGSGTLVSTAGLTDNRSSSSSAHPSRIVESTKLIGHWYTDLRDALHDLDQAREEAREDEFPAPSEKTLRNARRLLHAMYRISPRRFEVYPTPDGEIAVDAPGGPGCSVLLLCDPDGGALCLVNMNGAHRRARYSDTRGLPDGFVREALSELEQRRDTLVA